MKSFDMAAIFLVILCRQNCFYFLHFNMFMIQLGDIGEISIKIKFYSSLMPTEPEASAHLLDTKA